MLALLASLGWLYFVRSLPQRADATPESPKGARPVARSAPRGTSARARMVKAIDLNSAPVAELQTIPGITAAYAESILKGRPYVSMADLERTGIPQSVLNQISPPAIIRVTGVGGPMGQPTDLSLPNVQQVKKP
jgi:hypothetical protein